MNDLECEKNDQEDRRVVTTTKRYCAEVENAPFYESFFRKLQVSAVRKNIF